jgi:anaerobic nitric oxide reductase transcription regulator
MLSADTFARIALDLQRGSSPSERFEQLIQSVRQLFHSDASALLRYDRGTFVPLAIDGLSADVMGRRFRVSEHPRLEAIARAGDVVRFPPESDLPDPYDSLIDGLGHLPVHACMGIPLLSDGVLIGALTIDGLNPSQFDAFDDEDLGLIGALASAALANALLLEQMASDPHGTANPPMRQLAAAAGDGEMIGTSAAMQQLRGEIGVVAGTDLNVLILGETGTGKELIARAVHAGSARRASPLVYLNCAALPESVAESELFGHVKGAFTGAIHNRTGKFELAHQGTLFLDEIGELPLSLQAKLLRVLQYGDLQRIGDDSQRKVDVRVIAATNKDLKAEIVAGQFRADLYHRLSVFPLHAPALRERIGDIPLLTGFFLERWRGTMGLNALSIDPATLDALAGRQWHGNVRELEHVLRRAAVLARAEQGGNAAVIHERHVCPGDGQPAAPQAPLTPTPDLAPGTGLNDATDAFQRTMIRKAVDDCGGNWAAAARRLSLDPGNLHRLALRLGLK